MDAAPDERTEEPERNEPSLKQHRLRRGSQPVHDGSERNAKQDRHGGLPAEQDVDEFHGDVAV